MRLRDDAEVLLTRRSPPPALPPIGRPGWRACLPIGCNDLHPRCDTIRQRVTPVSRRTAAHAGHLTSIVMRHLSGVHGYGRDHEITFNDACGAVSILLICRFFKGSLCPQ